MWLLQGINSSQFFTIDQMLRGAMRELANQYPGGIYVHWGFWHNAEPDRAELCAKLLVETDAREVIRMQCQANKFALYRIDTPEAFARFGGNPPIHPVWRNSDLDKVLIEARAKLAPGAAAPPAR
jgi:hypothetical protein